MNTNKQVLQLLKEAMASVHKEKPIDTKFLDFIYTSDNFCIFQIQFPSISINPTLIMNKEHKSAQQSRQKK